MSVHRVAPAPSFVDHKVWKKDAKTRPLVGFDTETCHGNVHALCGSDGTSLVDIEDHLETEVCLAAIFRPGSTGVWWNLRYDAECILKHLDEADIEALLSFETVKVGAHKVRYLPGKMLRVSRGQASSTHYDIAQFFASSLEKASRRFLKTGKLRDVDRKQIGRDLRYWHEHEAEIVRYCARDAKLTKRLGDLWRGWSDDLGLPSDTLISPANIAGKLAQDDWTPWPKRMHETVGKAAWASYFGGRFEHRVKGRADRYLWDINSAYPAKMVQLARWDVPWKRVENERAALASPQGFVFASFRHAEGPWGFIPHRTSEQLTFPVGALARRWVTLDEYRFAKSQGVRCRFTKAWVADDTGERPLAWVKKWWRQKEKLAKADDPRALPVKTVINGLYGKMIETRDESWSWRRAHGSENALVTDDGEAFDARRKHSIGPLYNPIWAAQITAHVRVQLMRVATEQDVDMTATDGVLTTERLPPKLRGSGLGEWSLKAQGDSVIVGSGLYEIEKTVKRRGFGLPHDDWSWFRALEESRPGATQVSVWHERPVHPGECMIRSDLTLRDVGIFVRERRVEKLNEDRKRVFPRVTAQKLLRSTFVGSPRRL